MSVLVIALVVICLFYFGYRLYGSFLARRFGLDDSHPTPACTLSDGMDFVPTSPPILLAQHFSSIAAAGPIVGPILAGLWFGWLPALLWIVLGCIFIGAVHDFSSLVVSIRHQARSIAEVVREQVSLQAYYLFLTFIWLSLNYVIIAFADLTASTFLDPALGAGVATSSFLYLLLAMLLGLSLYKWNLSLTRATLISLPVLFFIIWFGQEIPITLPSWFALNPAKGWAVVILLYCFIASILPMWFLLQPRGYLGGYFLYAALLVGLSGLLFGGYSVQYPAFVSYTNPKGAPLFPVLFITIACGACSGFHGLVCSGTSSKQIAKEGHSHPVGYGGMILEGLVALIALTTVMILAPGDPVTKLPPERIYAGGLGRFLELFGISATFGMTFGLLAFATFVYDTLDVATRLGRYIFEELCGWKGSTGRIGATIATLLLPGLVLMTTKEQAYLRFWPIFGASNQLLAALTLLGISVWLARTGINPLVTLVPMGFVMVMTLWSLGLQMKPWITGLLRGNFSFDLIGAIAALLIVVALLLIRESLKVLISIRGKKEEELATNL